MPKEIKIMLGIALLVLAGGVFLLFSSPSPEEASKPVDSNSLLREKSHMTGSLDAKVTVVEFGDYQCPACAAIESTVEQMIAKYSGNKDFNFVFRNFPLAQHRNAKIAAEAAESAGAQGKFWEMHNMLYKNQNAWAEASNPLEIFVAYAKELGLDADKLRQEVVASKYASVINADFNDGIALGVNSTPTFYVNGVVVGAGDLQRVVDEKMQ